MILKYDSYIVDDFEGWDGDAVYELDNGTKWRLAHYKYEYHYIYRPKAKIWQSGTKYFLEVEGMDEKVEVLMD